MQPQQPSYPPAQQYPPPAPPAAPPAAPQSFVPATAPSPYAAPPAPGYPPPQYGPPPGYPPAHQPYADPYAVTSPHAPAVYGGPQQPPPVAGTLDQFYAQPSTGGGKALSFETPGTSYTGIVTRPVGDGDIQQMTDPVTGRPSTFRDGRPKFVMKVPLQMQPHPLYPDGVASWWVKGNDRDELVRAMAEASAPEGPPEAGAIITITMTGTRPAGAGMSPMKLKKVTYQRPQGAAPAPHAAAQQPPAQPTSPAPAQPPAAYQPAPSPAAYQPAPPPVYATNGNATPAAVAPPTPAAVAPPAAPPPPAPAAELSAEQQALLAQLTGAPAQ